MLLRALGVALLLSAVILPTAGCHRHRCCSPCTPSCNTCCSPHSSFYAPGSPSGGGSFQPMPIGPAH